MAKSVRLLSKRDIGIFDVVGLVQLVCGPRVTGDGQGADSGVRDDKWRIDSFDIVRISDDNSSVIHSNRSHDKERLLRYLMASQTDGKLG